MKRLTFPLALTVLLALALIAWPGPLAALWITPDQLGRWHYERGAYRAAAAAFEDPMWKGIASYAAGDFVAASQILAALDTPDSHLLRGNALAQRERLEAALAAYRRALRLAPQSETVQFNIEWVSDLIVLREAGQALSAEFIAAPDVQLLEPDEQDSELRLALPAGRTQGLNDTQLEAMWMRRVQTTPADFLSQKFAFQAAADQSDAEKQP